MKNPIAIAHPLPESSQSARWTLFSCGVWLRIGSVGVLMLGAGLLQLFNGEMDPLSALALTAGGGALSVVAWWRVKAILADADKDAVAAAADSSPAIGAGA